MTFNWLANRLVWGDLLVKGADFNAVIQAKKDRNQGFVFRDEEKSSMKKQIFKKALASLLAAVMLAALMPGTGAAGSSTVFAEGEEPETSGQAGIGVSWAYADGVLTISGNGKMFDWNSYNMGDDPTPYAHLLSDIRTVIIKNGVTRVGDDSFRGCSNLASVSIPTSVTSLGRYAFAGCTSLKSIEIPDTVTLIEWEAFEDCTGLTTIEIPSSVKTIDDQVFRDCTGLTSITLHEGLNRLGETSGRVFSGCTSLKSIYIPASVTAIGESPFEGCTNLTGIRVNSDNLTYDSRENCNAIIESDTNELIAGCKTTVIPDGVFGIKKYAFYLNKGLTSIEIPSSVDTIGEYAFDNCTNLAAVELSSGLITIERYAFDGCKSLEKIEIPSSVTSIGDGAFEFCAALKSITLPESLEEISSRLASESGVTSIKIPSGVTAIGEYAFEGCPNLKSVEIPLSVTQMGCRAFAECDNLTDVYYEGSEDDWNCISYNGKHWDDQWYEWNWPGDGMTMHYNSSMSGGGDDEEIPGKGFRIPEDTNAFRHNEKQFFWGEEKNGSDLNPYEFYLFNRTYRSENRVYYYPSKDMYYALTDPWTSVETSYTYSMSDVFFYRLINGLSRAEKEEMKNQMNSKWEGSCHGIAVTMALASQGVNTDEINILKTYHQSGAPKDNRGLRDAINFYQLSQSVSWGVDTHQTWSPERMQPFYREEMNLGVFLKEFVKESLRASRVHKPFVFSFSVSANKDLEEGYGHAIVVFGAQEKADNKYEIELYDENAAADPEKAKVPITCYVDLTANTIEFEDAIGTTIDNSNYAGFGYIGIDDLYGRVALNQGGSGHSSGGGRHDSFLTINSGSQYTIINDRGEYLKSDGAQFTGSMTVNDADMIAKGGGDTVRLYVDPYESLSVDDMSSEFEISGEIGDEYYTASVEGADSVTISDGMINITGDDYTFEAGTSAGVENEDLYKISAQAHGSVQLNAENGVISVNSEQPLSDTVITTLGDNTTDYQETTSDTQSITINTADGGNDIEIVPAAQTDIANCSVTIDPSEIEYDGYAWEPWVYVYYGTRELVNGTDFTVEFADNVNAGTARVIVTGRGDFTGTTEATFTITKAANKITKVTASKKIKYAKLKKKTQTFKIAATVKGKAKKTFKLKTVPKKAKKYIKVSSAGKVTVRKGLKKGTYKIKVQITAAATSNYKKTTATKTIKVIVK